MHLSVIIPCRNEKKRIGKTLERIRAYLSQQNYDWEIIVVDNGSKDGTAGVLEKYKKNIPNMLILTEKSHGKGWAVKQGMLSAKGDYRLFTDADNSTDIAQVEKLLEYAKGEGRDNVGNSYDVVISSRKVRGAVLTKPQPWYRVWLGNIFIFFTSYIVPLGGIKDTQNGFKLFTRKSAEKIFPYQTIYHWAFDVEILALARIFGFKIKEVPITWVNDEDSRIDLKGMVRMAYDILLIRFRLMTKGIQ